MCASVTVFVLLCIGLFTHYYLYANVFFISVKVNQIKYDFYIMQL